MATATTTKDSTATALKFDVEETVPKRSRGRAYDPETVAIKEVLLASQKDQKARSVPNVETDKQRNDLGNKIRSAAKAIGNGFEVKTIWEKESKKLFFGPAAVIDQLVGKSGS